MSDFKDRVKQELDVFFNLDEFAEEIVYGSSVIRAVVDFAENLKMDGSSATQEATIQVKKDDVSDPSFGDLVVFSGKNWSVERVTSGDDETWTIAIRRDERVRFRN